MYYLLLFVFSFEITYKFQLEVCNCCHDLMQKAMSFINVAIASVKGNDCRIHFCKDGRTVRPSCIMLPKMSAY